MQTLDELEQLVREMSVRVRKGEHHLMEELRRLQQQLSDKLKKVD